MAPTLTRPDSDEDEDLGSDESGDAYQRPERVYKQRDALLGPSDLASKEAQGYGPYDREITPGGETLPQRKERQALSGQNGLFHREGDEAAYSKAHAPELKGKNGLFHRDGDGAAHGALHGAGDAINDKLDGLSDKQKGVLFGAGGGLSNKIDGMSDKKKGILFGAGGLFKGGGKKGKGAKMAMLLGGGGGLLGLIALVMFIFIMVGNLKAVHFATVLRSTGFAATQIVMRRSFSQITYDSVMLTDDSTGSLNQYERSALDRLRRIKPDKVMTNLGAEGKFKVVQEGNRVLGFEIEGKRVLKDDLAQESFKKNFKDLSFREKATVKQQFLASADNQMAKILNAESQTFRNGFYKGFRQHFKIRTQKWTGRQLRDLIGKEPAEARIDTKVEDLEKITAGDAPPDSTIEEVDKVAKKTRAERIRETKLGIDRRGKTYVNNALKSSGLPEAKELSSTLGKASLAVFAGTIYCTARDVNNSITALNHEKEQDAYRMSHDIQTTSDQIKAHDINGASAVNGVAVGVANSQWDARPDIPPAEASPFYKGSTGRNTSGLPAEAYEGIPTGKIDNSKFQQMFDAVDASLIASNPTYAALPPAAKKATIDFACGGILDPKVQYALLGGEAVASIVLAIGSGGTSEGIKQAVKTAITVGVGVYASDYLGRWLEDTISNFAGTSFTGTEQGIDKYSGGAVSTDYLNSATAHGVAYGRPVPPEEAKASKLNALKEEREYYNSMAWQTRYFSIDNPFSLVGNLAAQAPSSLDASTLMARYGNSPIRGFGGFQKNIASILLSPFGNQKVSAAAQVQEFMAENNYFNTPQWTYTPEENAIMANHPDYDYVSNTAWVLEHNANGELDQRFDKCYTPKSLVDVPPECTADYLKTAEALHWRIYKNHEGVIKQMEGLQAPTNNDSPSANSANPGGGLGISPDGFVFPLKTTKAKIKGMPRMKWCWQSQTNCHHDYNAADIFADPGTPVVAAKGGRVIFGHNRPTGGTGSSFAIMGEDNNVYWYGHLKSGSVKYTGGETVKAGDEVGQVGEDADAQGTPSHLHIDVQPPPATTRESCTNQACAQPPFHFLDIQPPLTKSFGALPD